MACSGRYRLFGDVRSAAGRHLVDGIVDARQWRPGHHRSIRAAGEHHAPVQVGFLRVAPRGAVPPPGGQGGAAGAVDEVLLRYADDAQAGHPVQNGRAEYACVLYPVAVVCPRASTEGSLIAIQAHRDGLVADGVDRPTARPDWCRRKMRSFSTSSGTTKKPVLPGSVAKGSN